MTNKEAEAALRALHHDLGELLAAPERLELRVDHLAKTWSSGRQYVWHLQGRTLPVTEETYERILRDAWYTGRTNTPNQRAPGAFRACEK